jgi:hypothetical protein
MKVTFHRLKLVAITLLTANNAGAQGFAFNTTGAAAAASSMMDVSSTTKGALLPRMTGVQMNAIGSPAQGLVVYNTTQPMHFTFTMAVYGVQLAVVARARLVLSRAEILFLCLLLR